MFPPILKASAFNQLTNKWILAARRQSQVQHTIWGKPTIHVREDQPLKLDVEPALLFRLIPESSPHCVPSRQMGLTSPDLGDSITSVLAVD